VALRLREEGIEAYCPVKRQEKQWSDRRKVTEEPLFRSYLFVNIDLAIQSAVVRRTLGVVNFVYWLNKPAVIQDDEIVAIQQFLSEHASVEVLGNTLQVGDFITIDAGALKGQKAEVTGIKNRHEVRLRIDSLGFELVARVE
jgi:transcription antitermination factor NusG